MISKKLPEITLIDNFISITGSSVYGKHEPNDLDIVIRIPDEVFNFMNEHFREFIQSLIMKLQRIFKDKRIHIIPSSIGPTFNHIPIYRLKLEPIKEIEVVDVNEPEFQPYGYFQELRAATPEIQKQAEQSKKEDKIVFGRFFFPEKTNLPAVMLLKGRGIENALEWVQENKPVVVNKKYDGNRLIIFVDKEKNEVIYFSEDGRKISEKKFPETTKELLNLNGKNFILDCECERWIDGKHQNREDVAGYLHNKTEFDDTGIVLNIFDILYYNDEDIHKKPYIDRLTYLFKLGIKQSTIKIPDTKFHLNLVPAYIVNTKLEARESITLVSNAPASEGAMLKKANAPYSLKGYDDNWLKVKKYETLKVIVLKVNSTKVPTVVNFEIGVRFKDENVNEKEVVELNGKKYLKVGKTFNVKKGFAEVGDIISVIFHTANLYKKDDKISFRIYEPIVEEKHPEEAEPDYLSNCIEKARISGLLVEKFIEDLNTYDPKKVNDKVLIDDYRWLITWLTADIKKYNKELIKKKLKEVIQEIFRRGIATLHPTRYNEEAKEIVIDILKELKIPELKYFDPETVMKEKIIVSKAKLNDLYVLKDKDNQTFGIIKIIGEENGS